MMVKGTTIQPHSDLEATNVNGSSPLRPIHIFVMLGRNIWLLEFKLGA
jgi:hypothetical protein